MRPSPTHLGDRGRAQHWETGDDLAVHIDLMRRQVLRSLEDPETRSLAVAITSGAYDSFVDPRTGQPVPVIPFHGRMYRAAIDWKSGALCRMRDERCEINAIWNFVVLNLRYLQDVRGQDTYASLRASLEVGGGDCFPVGTLLLRDDHELVPVEAIRPGDRIWGLNDWSTVEAAWFKGWRPITRLRLNNGSWLALTEDHKVYVRVDGREERIPVSDLTVGMELVQPDRIAFAETSREPDADLALLQGLYLSDGWANGKLADAPSRFAISGLDGSFKEEQKRVVQRICEARGLHSRWNRKYISVNDAALATRFSRLGHKARFKRAESLHLDEGAAGALLRGIMADADRRDGTLTTTSRQLAVQARVLHRMFGVQTSWSFIESHGGLGEHPIYRVGQRSKRPRRLVVREILREVTRGPVYDLTTSDHRVYLPEHDVTVSNCDDFAIVFASLLGAVGYGVAASVISVQGSTWDHVYAVARTKGGWVPLDPTEPGKVPGWEYPRPAARENFMLTEAS